MGNGILCEAKRHDHLAMFRFLPSFLMFFFACSVQAESHVDDTVAKILEEESAKSYFDIVRSLAENERGGDSNYQYELGLMYAKGKEVPKNDAEAVRWFRKSAEQGYALG